MEKLELAVKQKESQFINQAQAILNSECSDRIKIAKLYQTYVSCMASINTIVSDVRIVPQQASSVNP